MRPAWKRQSGSDRARPRDRGLSRGAALLTGFCFKKRLFRRDAETSTPQACATQNSPFLLQLTQKIPALVVAPLASGGCAILRHWAIRPDSEAQNDPGKIAWFHTGAGVRGFRRDPRF